MTFHDVAFEFQEYAPIPFLSLREAFGIQNDAFVRSMAELKGGQVCLSVGVLYKWHDCLICVL